MKFIRFAFILGFALGALYHLFLAFFPTAGDPATGGRHLLFVLINGVSFIIMVMNHPRVLLALLALVVQQLYSHGLFFWQQWRDVDRVDWPSVVVILSMPVLCYYILKRSSDSRKSP